MHNKLSIVMLGATGAVGGEALKTILTFSDVEKVSILGRRPVENIEAPYIHQHKVDIFEPSSYNELLSGHDIAICTLGVGQPSKMSKEQFLKIDKIAVLDFAKACKAADVKHFELLSSVGISAESSNYFLKAKGELVEELKALSFERLSIFKPSMILTPTNRYGFGQAVTLAVWPVISPLLLGGLKKYRGIKVEQLGGAIARNVLTAGSGFEEHFWEDFNTLNS